MTKDILERVSKGVIGNYTEMAEKEWDKMVKKFIIEDQSISSTVTIEATDNWIEYTLRYVVDYKKRRQIKNDLFIRILREINATNGAIEFASTTIEVKTNPPHSL